jgi:hypothetical protein
MNPNVTQLLTAFEHGDPHAASRLLPLGYDELLPTSPVAKQHGDDDSVQVRRPTEQSSRRARCSMHSAGAPTGILIDFHAESATVTCLCMDTCLAGLLPPFDS